MLLERLTWKQIKKARDNRAQEQREAEARANTQNNRNNTGANDLTGVNANIA